MLTFSLRDLHSARRSGAAANPPAPCGPRSVRSRTGESSTRPPSTRLRSAFLLSDGLHKLADPQPAGRPSRSLSRQRVVGSDNFVAVGDVGLGTKEQGAIIAHPVREPSRFSSEYFHMFKGEAVGFFRCFFATSAIGGLRNVPGLRK